MKKLYTLIIALSLTVAGLSQLQGPTSTETGLQPNWDVHQTKALGDSCGFYHNEYVGLTKTSTLYFEPMRTGNGTEQTEYSGRAQRFSAPQPIQIMGVQFFGFETNPLVDSVMAITAIHQYIAGTDDVGPEIIRDTVWVTHQTFSPALPNREVNSVFDSIITVSSDYIVAISTPDDDSLKIYASDRFVNDGNNEGVSYILYDNQIAFPGFYQWYNVLGTFGAAYDYDYLINPLIKYDITPGFTVVDDTICPEVVSAGCVNYSQSPIYADHQYNSSSAAPSSNLQWLWGDGFQNTNITTACHTYNNQGDFVITLNDTIYRHNFNSGVCVGVSTEMIHVKDTVIADFTFATGGIIVDFTSTASNADSLAWDFGDGNTGGDSLTIQHNYDSLGTFDVWLYAYNECGVDSVMMQVTTDDVGVDDYNFAFKMYPNPANEQVFVTGLIEGAQVDLINILGESIRSNVATQNNMAIDLNDLSKGTYFVRVSTEYGYVTKKLVVRN